MQQIYEKLTREGKIGPRDAQGNLRPFAEYPKAVRGDNGATKVVASQREELAFLSEQPLLAADDPVVAEKNRLAIDNAEKDTELAKLRAQLAELGGVAAGALQGVKPSVTSPPAPNGGSK